MTSDILKRARCEFLREIMYITEMYEDDNEENSLDYIENIVSPETDDDYREAEKLCDKISLDDCEREDEMEIDSMMNMDGSISLDQILGL